MGPESFSSSYSLRRVNRGISLHFYLGRDYETSAEHLGFVPGHLFLAMGKTQVIAADSFPCL